MYGMVGFAKKLNIQSYENLTENSVRYICMECLDLPKNWISRTAKIQRQILYIIYVRKVWIYRKIEYPELLKFNGNLGTLYMYETFGFPKKLNIHNCKNSTGNCVHYTYTEWLDVEKNWISRAAKIQRKILYVIYLRNVWIRKKMECPKLRKFNGKLCVLCMYGMSGLAKKLNIQNCVN